MNFQNISSYTDAFIIWLSAFGLNLLGAAVVFFGGVYVINWIGRVFNQSMTRGKIDVSLQSFFTSLIMAGLRVLLLVTVAGMLGMQTTSFVAIIGALGLAVGLALQGSLGNFAGGVLILVFKPFKVGDIIESQGQTGAVTEIQIFNTILLTPDNKTVILANGAVSNNTVVNFSRHGSIRVDIAVVIDGANDIDRVRQIVTSACLHHQLVLKTPAPSVNVSALNEDNVTIGISAYTSAQNYWTVFYDVQELVKKAFDEHGVTLPQSHMYITQLHNTATPQISVA